MIDNSLSSSEQYFRYLVGVNKLNKIFKKKTIHKWGRDVWIGATTFDCHWKGKEKLGRDKKFSLCSGYNMPTCLQNLQNRSLTCRGYGTLQVYYTVINGLAFCNINWQSLNRTCCQAISMDRTTGLLSLSYYISKIWQLFLDLLTLQDKHNIQTIFAKIKFISTHSKIG